MPKILQLAKKHQNLGPQLNGLASATFADFVGSIGDCLTMSDKAKAAKVAPNRIASPQVLPENCWDTEYCSPFFGTNRSYSFFQSQILPTHLSPWSLDMPIAAGGRNPICVARIRPTSNGSPWPMRPVAQSKHHVSVPKELKRGAQNS